MSVDLVVDQELNETAQAVKDQDGNSSPLSLTRDGYVGVGTTSPLASFHVHGSDPADQVTLLADLPSGGVPSAGVIMARYGDQFPGQTDAGESLAGNVEIGVAGLVGHIIVNPGADRDVIYEAGSRETARIKGDSGRVGIGTKTPRNSLEVNGTIRAMNLVLNNIQHVSTAPSSENLKALCVDRTTGQLYCGF